MIFNHPKQEVSPGVAFGHTCARNTKNPVLHPVHGSLRMIVGMNFVSIDVSTTTRRPKKVSYELRWQFRLERTHTHTHTHTTLYSNKQYLRLTMSLVLFISLFFFVPRLHRGVIRMTVDWWLAVRSAVRYEIGRFIHTNELCTTSAPHITCFKTYCIQFHLLLASSQAVKRKIPTTVASYRWRCGN